jgi:WD40 repeat protein
MDCSVLVWDFSRGRPSHSFSTQPPAGASSSNQTLNPPFVNSLAFTTQGEHAIVGSGNGEIIVLDARKKEEKRRMLGHTHSVMHVSMLPFPPSFSAIAAFRSPTSCLLSAGNDQHLMLWDLQAALLDAARPAPAPTAASPPPSSSAATKNRKKKERARAKKQAAAAASSVAAEDVAADEEPDEAGDTSNELSLDQLSVSDTATAAAASSSSSVLPGFSSPWLPASLAFSDPERVALDTTLVRYRWRHPHKINAVATSMGMRDVSMKGPPSLDPPEVLCTSGVCVYVADTTNNITAYHLR